MGKCPSVRHTAITGPHVLLSRSIPSHHDKVESTAGTSGRGEPETWGRGRNKERTQGVPRGFLGNPRRGVQRAHTMAAAVYGWLWESRL
ncbi:hypothetical protein CLIM01_11827 [Colletotrichum limetticola]|nr:hypothetical protein CLIM01_11827 [Colletotrichum limetticola]